MLVFHWAGCPAEPASCACHPEGLPTWVAQATPPCAASLIAGNDKIFTLRLQRAFRHSYCPALLLMASRSLPFLASFALAIVAFAAPPVLDDPVPLDTGGNPVRV